MKWLTIVMCDVWDLEFSGILDFVVPIGARRCQIFQRSFLFVGTTRLGGCQYCGGGWLVGIFTQWKTYFLSHYDEFILEKINIFVFYIISQHWDDTGRWNLPSRKAMTHLSCIVNAMVVDNTAPQAWPRDIETLAGYLWMSTCLVTR